MGPPTTQCGSVRHAAADGGPGKACNRCRGGVRLWGTSISITAPVVRPLAARQRHRGGAGIGFAGHRGYHSSGMCPLDDDLCGGRRLRRGGGRRRGRDGTCRGWCRGARGVGDGSVGRRAQPARLVVLTCALRLSRTRPVDAVAVGASAAALAVRTVAEAAPDIVQEATGHLVQFDDPASGKELLRDPPGVSFSTFWVV